MNWKEYQTKAITTATYNTKEKGITCCGFGLNGEIYEYEEKVNVIAQEYNEILAQKELGDFAWYLSSISHLMEFELSLVKDCPMCIEEAFGTIALLQELLKKSYRDFDFAKGNKYEDRIKGFLNQLYSFFILEVELMNWSLDDIFNLNLTKLGVRKENGTLLGEGDIR